MASESSRAPRSARLRRDRPAAVAGWLALAVFAQTFLRAPEASAKGGLELYGDIAQVALPVFAGGVSLVKEDYAGTAQLMVGTGITLGTVQALKYGLDTERPDGGSRSFPSGHTAAAFAGASYLHYRYGWEWGLPTYAAAALVGYSRVDADRHYWYDVVAGAAIANAVAYVMTDRVDENVVIVPIFELVKKDFGLLARIEF